MLLPIMYHTLRFMQYLYFANHFPCPSPGWVRPHGRVWRWEPAYADQALPIAPVVAQREEG